MAQYWTQALSLSFLSAGSLNKAKQATNISGADRKGRKELKREKE